MQMIATSVINVNTVAIGIGDKVLNSLKTVITGKDGRNELFAINATIVLRAKGGRFNPIAPTVRFRRFQFNAKLALTANFGISRRLGTPGLSVIFLIFIRTAATLTIDRTVATPNIVTMHFAATIVTSVKSVTIAVVAIIVATLRSGTILTLDNIAASGTFGVIVTTARFAMTIIFVNFVNAERTVTIRTARKIVRILPILTVGIFVSIVTLDMIPRILTDHNIVTMVTNRHDRLHRYNVPKRPLSDFIA